MDANDVKENTTIDVASAVVDTVSGAIVEDVTEHSETTTRPADSIAQPDATTPTPTPTPQNEKFQKILTLSAAYRSVFQSSGDVDVDAKRTPIKMVHVPRLAKALVHEINNITSDPERELGPALHQVVREEIGSIVMASFMKSFQQWMKEPDVGLNAYSFDSTEFTLLALEALKYFDAQYAGGAPIQVFNVAGLLFHGRKKEYERTLPDETCDWLIKQARAQLDEWQTTCERQRRGEKIEAQSYTPLTEQDVRHLSDISLGFMPWGYRRAGASFQQTFIVDPFFALFKRRTVLKYGGAVKIELPLASYNQLMLKCNRELVGARKWLITAEAESSATAQPTANVDPTVVVPSDQEKRQHEEDLTFVKMLIEQLEKVVTSGMLPDPFCLKLDDLTASAPAPNQQ